MDILARPSDSSIVTPVSAIRPFLLAVDELEDEESSEWEVVRDFRAGATASMCKSRGAAAGEERAGSSTVLLPRCEPAALSRLTVRDKENISHRYGTCCHLRSPQPSVLICQTRWCLLVGNSIPSSRAQAQHRRSYQPFFPLELDDGVTMCGMFFFLAERLAERRIDQYLSFFSSNRQQLSPADGAAGLRGRPKSDEPSPIRLKSIPFEY